VITRQKLRILGGQDLWYAVIVREICKKKYEEKI